MNWCFQLLAGVLLSGLLTPAIASLQEDQLRIDAEHIERDPAWRALLHYRVDSDGSVRSQADRQDFFMAADGKQSARAELLAAAAALHEPAQAQAFACRFPARYEWLRERLGHAGAASAPCPQLASWLAGFPGRRMSINFASSYLENPSSTFGHSFLRIVEHSSSELLSPTINYAARTEARDSDLAFVYKGLFGGFPGVADQLPFYRRLRTYADTEGRDIHEYDLALTPAEVRRVILHTWEIRDGIFDYYFLDENCAYRTLALLDAARPQAGLLTQFARVTVPIDTIRVLRSAGMLGQQRVWPSGPRHVRELEAQLPLPDAALARSLALGQSAPGDIEGMPAVRAAAILQLAYEYGAVLIDRDEGVRAVRKEVLVTLARARLASATPEPLARGAAALSPEAGHDGGLWAAGLRRRGGRHALSLEYAAFQHTLTSPLPGYEPHAEISLLNPEVELQDGGLRLRRVDWLLVQSAIPSSTLFGPRAWRIALATRDAPFAARDHLATSLAYHSGKAWQLGGATVLTLLPGLGLEASAAHEHRAALAGALHAALTRQGALWSAQVAQRAEKFVAGSALRRTAAHAKAEFALSRNVSLLAGAAQRWSPRRETEVNFSLQWRHRSLGAPWQD